MNSLSTISSPPYKINKYDNEWIGLAPVDPPPKMIEESRYGFHEKSMSYGLLQACKLPSLK
jgi:hypothetical protein